MQSIRSGVKRVIAPCAVTLCLLACGGQAAYAEGRGYQPSSSPARSNHWNAPRPFHAPSGRTMGTSPQQQTETRRLPERETASSRWNISSTVRRDRSAPEHRAVEAWRQRPAEARRVPEWKTAPANRQWNISSTQRRDRFVPEHRRFVPERRPVHALPPRHQVVIHHGTPFHFFHGGWYRPFGPRFIPVVAPIGAVVHVLPAYHWRIWFYSVPFPYYYVNNVYYVQSSQGYVVAEPPPQQIIQEEPVSATDGSAVTEEPADNGNLNQANADQLYVYPKQGQGQQQLDQDREECRSWAGGQTGYSMPSASAPNGGAIENYERALSACLEGRGYTVR